MRNALHISNVSTSTRFEPRSGARRSVGSIAKNCENWIVNFAIWIIKMP